jgi:hypothetical protein
MSWSTLAGATLLALAPALATAQTPTTSKNGDRHDVRLQGCVVAGTDAKTAALASVTEIAEPGQSIMPPEAHGRRVVFWLTPDDQIVQQVGHMVEVRGTTTGIEKSEIEFKAGRQPSGGLVAEFEGPGKDVKVSTDVIGDAIGTSGRGAADKSAGNEVKTFLVRVNVQEVKPLPNGCNQTTR